MKCCHTGFFGIQILQNSISACPIPHWRSLRCSHNPLVGWGGDTPSPFPTPLDAKASRLNAKVACQQLFVLEKITGYTILQKYARLFSYLYTHTQPFYGSLDFVRDNPGEPVPEETFIY